MKAESSASKDKNLFLTDISEIHRRAVSILRTGQSPAVTKATAKSFCEY
jgi:hypothetical protein